MNPIIQIYPNPTDVARKFAVFFADLVKAKAKINVALSGGSTPKLLFDLLAADDFQDLDWKKVHLFWGDERCVPPEDQESNYKMTLDHLLSKIDVPEINVHRIRGEDDPQQEAIRYGIEISSNVVYRRAFPSFDLIILGMGEDGHTASIFPHELHLLTSPEICAVARHPQNGQQRVTLTGKVINNAEIVAFLVTGVTKAEKVELISSQRGKWRDYPAAHVQPVDGELHWFLDEAAAGL